MFQDLSLLLADASVDESRITQYAVLAVFTCCALMTLVTYVLWRNKSGSAENPLEPGESQPQ